MSSHFDQPVAPVRSTWSTEVEQIEALLREKRRVKRQRLLRGALVFSAVLVGSIATAMVIGTMPGLAVLAIVGAIYFLPVMIAASNRHPHAAGITVLTLFLGWTFVGWVVALVWAVTFPRDR